jgi:hypothetical protein
MDLPVERLQNMWTDVCLCYLDYSRYFIYELLNIFSSSVCLVSNEESGCVLM